MNISKKALLAALAAATLTISASAAFEKKNIYTEGQFTDVTADKWYAKEVQSTVELGLMQGVGNNCFAPEGNVTVAEAITMACRAAAINAGEEIPAVDGQWYQMYVNYAVAKGFVKEGQYDNFDRPAKRYEVAQIFEGAMPEGYYVPKNDISEIPDVEASHPYHADLLNLYKAGIVMGSDTYGNFRPEDNITRAEAATIITRVALPEKRLVKSLDKISSDDAYLLTSITGYTGSNHIGMKSGWLLDNRGGVPKTTISVNSGVITDISTDAGTAVIREFNKTTTGNIVLEADYELVDSIDGAYIEYVNEAGASVYRIEVIDGAWNVLDADGNYTKIRDAKAGDKYVLNISVDLDNSRSTTIFNGENAVTHPLALAGSDVIALRFGTTEKSMATAGPGNVDMYVNYAVYNKFSFDSEGAVPYGWTGNGVVKGELLEIPSNGGSAKAFNPVSGKVAAEADIFIDSNTKATYALNSGAKNVVLMKFDGKNINVNGQNIYEYYDGLWYRFRFELDTVNMKVLVKINGREIATVDMAEKATSVDNISVYNAGSDVLKSDNYKVFELQTHEDYVPAPVKPAGEEKYTVGMNICSLWVEGTHYGWATISPFEKPVIGYYDEGSKESADWEIKYMVEHGIDFQAFCWYADQSNTYLKTPKLVSQLHDGYMNAEYSDAMKYCLIWEAGNGARPNNMDSFKKYYVPYFIENYFKDPRYMTIDNKPVLCFFSLGSLAGSSSLGSNAAVKEALDYLESEVMKLGYDGLIIIGNADQKQAGECGLDGIYAYNWGNAGYMLETNKSSILRTANGTPYTVPTISVGFNSIPWHGKRYPMMTGENFLKAHEWVKNEYLPTYAKEEWQKNFVMYSTWNEYGEGTFIMPGEQNGGFAYLDASREAYTDEKADQSINIVPTEEQLARITRMYPQYRRHLRDTGFSELEEKSEGYDVVCEIDFTKMTDATALDPTKLNDISFSEERGMTYTNGINDAYFFCKFEDGLNLKDVVAIRLTAEFTVGNSAEMFFVTKQSNNWEQKKSVQLHNIKEGMSEYIISLNKSVWVGDLTNLRVDAANKEGVTSSVKKIEFLVNKKEEPNEFVINGMKFTGKTDNVVLEEGTVLSAFDPSLAMDFRLNAFHTWDKDNGVLKLEFTKHTVVYTVGSDKFNVDGKDVDLGYKLYLEDGLPMIDFKKLCEAVGFTYSFNEGVTTIDTEQKEYFSELANKDPGHFEFNTVGNTEGWNSSHFKLSVNKDGFLRMDQVSTGTDVIMTNKLDVPLESRKYNAVKVRMKHEVDNKNTSWTIYFATDVDGTMNEAKAIRAFVGADSKGEFAEYTVDLSKLSTWSSNITNIRFDPYDAHGWAEVDYIRFYYDDNFEAPIDARRDDPNAQFNAKFDKFEIKNGDAEGEGGFFSRNGNISIVTDPDNPDNKCYLVLPKDDKQVWLYSDQEVRFNKGATYKVEADVKIAAHGTNTEPSPDFVGDFMVNAVYGDPGKSADHVVGRNERIKVSDGWVHTTCEFTVSAESIDRSQDKFCFYANPVEGVGVGYYFDNVKVTEILPEAEK